jgi:hypothetical protein
MKNLIILSVVLTIYSCGENNNRVVDANFKIPVIQQPTTTDTIEYSHPDFITGVYPIFAGKSKFCDTLELTEMGWRDTSCREDFIPVYISWNSDTLKYDGFELYPDYNTTVVSIPYFENKGYYCYPIYVVNQTPSMKTFTGKDDHVYAIQEALDSNQVWRPIEARGYEFCGNGSWDLKIHPGEFAVVLIHKYKGNYKTKLRVRLAVNLNTYVSAPFEGTIDYKQFYLDREEGYYYSELIEDKYDVIRYYFLGAEPMEVEGEDFGK